MVELALGTSFVRRVKTERIQIKRVGESIGRRRTSGTTARSRADGRSVHNLFGALEHLERNGVLVALLEAANVSFIAKTNSFFVGLDGMTPGFQEASKSLDVLGVASVVLVNLALVGDDHVAVAIDERLAERGGILKCGNVLAQLVDLGPDEHGVAIRVDAHAVDVVVEDVTVLVELAGLDQAGGDVTIGVLLTGFKVEMSINGTAEGKLALARDALAGFGGRGRGQGKARKAKERGGDGRGGAYGKLHFDGY